LNKIQELNLKNEKLLVIETERYGRLIDAQKTNKLYESRLDEMTSELGVLKINLEKEQQKRAHLCKSMNTIEVKLNES